MSLANIAPIQPTTLQAASRSAFSRASVMQTLFTRNYFQQGTYKKEFRDYYFQVGFITIAVKTILAPLQRWRIIKQTQYAYPIRPKKFQNIADYIKRIPKQQGYLSLWRGNGAGIMLFFWQSVFQIGIYDNMKNYMRKMVQQQQQGSLLSKFLQRIIYPAFATIATQAITYPFDVARVRLAMNYERQTKKSHFSGVRQAIMYIKHEQGGYKFIYRGFLFSNILSFVHLNAFLSLSALFKYVSIPAADKVKELQNSQIINVDVIVSLGALILTYPLDTIKKIIQLNNNSRPILFNNARGAFTYVKKEMSLTALFNGMQVSMLKTLMFLPIFGLCSTLVNNPLSSFQPKH